MKILPKRKSLKFLLNSNRGMEKKYHVIKLHFHSGLHLGKGKSHYAESDTILHSDTLAAALHVAARHLWEEKADAFSEKLRITSAFPFFGDELFFPKPQLRLPGFSDVQNDDNNAKKFKRIRYIGKDFFERLLNRPAESWPDAYSAHGGAFISKNESDTPIYGTDLQERVHIPGDGMDTLPYTLERIHFNKEAGLFFLAAIDSDILSALEQCLHWLGDQGIGTDRSVGNGQFVYSISEVAFHLPDSKQGVLLSLYSPSAAEYTMDGFLRNSQYSLLRRGGYISSPADEGLISLQKKSVYMFGEGSIFDHFEQCKGEIKNLRPEERINHPVWRDGRAFFLPCLTT